LSRSWAHAFNDTPMTMQIKEIGFIARFSNAEQGYSVQRQMPNDRAAQHRR